MATLVIYPDPSNGATTVDAKISRVVGGGTTFSDLRDGAGTALSTTDASDAFVQLECLGTSSTHQTLSKTIFTFDTSPIGGNSRLVSAMLSLYGTDKIAAIGETPMYVASAFPAANNNLVTGDYQKVGRTAFGNVPDTGSWSTSGYNDIALNALGLNNINKTGISAFSVQLGWDLLNDTTGLTPAAQQTYYIGYLADQTGTTNDPKLTVVYEPSQLGVFSQASVSQVAIAVRNKVVGY
jgi:hypothetical protein